MKTKLTKIGVTVALLLSVSWHHSWAQQDDAGELQVAAIALFNGKAMIKVNSAKPKIIKAGDSFMGVTLMASDTDRAIIEAAGQRQELTLNGDAVFGPSIASRPASGRTDETLVYADNNGFFRSEGSINGERLEFIVDTGANLVVLSGDQADHIELDYERAPRGYASTASGSTEIYIVSLDSITFNGLEMRNVRAGVVPGDFPEVALLGMSYLEGLDMRREGDKMTLKLR
ncbi:MAG: retroviral-like aspartic protease family protein [Gammaproteobacteria bacterium]|nr:retroviral-like aspartic protease family protein [Gammaproteobacteria bacterium]